MRRYIIAALVTAFMMVAASPDGSAQISGAADTSKEGSLLIWPKIQTDNGTETYILLTNNSSNKVCVKCYWEVKQARTNPAGPCLLSDFAMRLSARNSVMFRASDGCDLSGRGVAAGMGTGEEGVLKCWAVDRTLRKQISWNHLSGFAIVTKPFLAKRPQNAWQYSAWRFAANVIDSSGNFADGFWIGEVAGVGGADVNIMSLKASPTTVVTPANCPGPDYSAAACSLPNAAYDACPKYLTFDFLAEPTQGSTTDGFAVNNLALVPCKSDLTGDTLSLKTKIEYTIWNEDGLQYSGLDQCAGCAYESYLGKLTVLRTYKPFLLSNLHTPAGRFRVEGTAGAGCGAGVEATSMVGVRSFRRVGDIQVVGTNGTASGKETTDYGYIRWLPTGEYYQMKRR